MKQTNRFPALLAILGLLSIPAFSQNEQFEMREVACELSQPWEITYGPDNYLWVTQAHNYQITRIDPTTGEKQLLIDLSGKKNFPNNFDHFPQGGLMGLALHPDFLTTKPYVYVAYVYRFDTCIGDVGGCFFKTKLVRYNYDENTETLNNEVVICDTIPGSNDHNGGRLAIGPVSDQIYLFYSVGDMGAGHLGNRERAHHGQEPDKYEGKILRFNLEPDGDANLSDRWIPDDNPFDNGDVKIAVWSLGHRNPQGLVFGDNGILYESEHGPYSDDEINMIERQANYGFPLIMGFADGNYDGSAAGAGSTVPIIISEVDNAQAIGAGYRDPLMSFFPASQAAVSTIYQNDLNNTPPFDNYYLSWPSVAPSGIDFYRSDAIPGWKNSLLVANLKVASVYRLKLSADGMSFVGDTMSLFKGMGRFRDIAISPDGTKIYVSADSMGQVQGPPGIGVIPPNRGCILEFTYLTTSTEDPLAASIQVFPNPADRSIQMQLSALPDGPVRIIAFNALGLAVYEQAFNKIADQLLTLDISGWADGSYLLNILPENLDQDRRIMKKVTVLRGR